MTDRRFQAIGCILMLSVALWTVWVLLAVVGLLAEVIGGAKP